MSVRCKGFCENLIARWGFSKLLFEAKTLSALYEGVHKSSGDAAF